MKGLKASIVLVLMAAAACTFLIRSGAKPETKKIGGDVLSKYVEDSIITGEGTYPKGLCCMFADEKGMYSTRYDKHDSITLLDISNNKSQVVITPVTEGKQINAFCASGDYIAWEEDGDSLRDDESSKIYDWTIYVKKGDKIVKVDEGKPLKFDGNMDMEPFPQELCAYGDYMTYMTYDIIPGTKDIVAVIRLYDVNKGINRDIFTLKDVKNMDISDPCIYKDYIVWSTNSIKQQEGEGTSGGCVYLYDIKMGSYTNIQKANGYVKPVIWENYIAVSRKENGRSSITVIDIKNGFMRTIANYDSPIEVSDYSIGNGYVTWNKSNMDSLSVYDIPGDRIVELKKGGIQGTNTDSILNIRIFDKTVYFTDHVFDSRNENTLSEDNRYITLK